MHRELVGRKKYRGRGEGPLSLPPAPPLAVFSRSPHYVNSWDRLSDVTWGVLLACVAWRFWLGAIMIMMNLGLVLRRVRK